MELGQYVNELWLFLQDFGKFLGDPTRHTVAIAFAGVVWIAIVLHLLFGSEPHASVGSNGSSWDIGCGDLRVWRILVIFGGPAGLSFGLPYFWLMNTLGMTGVFREYWIGFIFIQFGTSVLQSILLVAYCILGPRGDKKVRLFKSHLYECGWVTSLSPVLWWTYWVKAFLLPKSLKLLFWPFRDFETLVNFVANVLTGQVIILCILGSAFNRRFIVPMVTWVDQDHAPHPVQV